MLNSKELLIYNELLELFYSNAIAWEFVLENNMFLLVLHCFQSYRS